MQYLGHISRQSGRCVLRLSGLLCAASLILSGCAESTLIAHSAKRITHAGNSTASVTTGAGTYKIGSAYKIQGKWYTPHEDYSYSEVGVASWYGPNFHGKKTANGERFDMYAMTAAHRTLPLPSIVRVTNLANNRSVILRVNDRGPFARDRILDVSKAGAQALGFIKQGTARVRVEIMPQESLALKQRILNGAEPETVQIASAGQTTEVVKVSRSYESKPLPPVQRQTSAKPVAQNISHKEFSPRPVVAANAHYIQVGAFGNPDNAAKLRDRLKHLGEVEILDVKNAAGVPLHKVRIGPIMGQKKTDAVLREVQSIGFTDAHVIAPKSL